MMLATPYRILIVDYDTVEQDILYRRYEEVGFDVALMKVGAVCERLNIDFPKVLQHFEQDRYQIWIEFSDLNMATLYILGESRF